MLKEISAWLDLFNGAMPSTENLISYSKAWGISLQQLQDIIKLLTQSNDRTQRNNQTQHLPRLCELPISQSLRQDNTLQQPTNQQRISSNVSQNPYYLPFPVQTSNTNHSYQCTNQVNIRQNGFVYYNNTTETLQQNNSIPNINNIQTLQQLTQTFVKEEDDDDDDDFHYDLNILPTQILSKKRTSDSPSSPSKKVRHEQ